MLFITGVPLNFYAQVGLVLLIGLSTKTAIIVVEFARDLREGRERDCMSLLFRRVLCASEPSL